MQTNTDMNINFKINNNELSESEIKIIKNSLGLNNSTINEALSNFAKAAFMEYVKMIKDNGLPSKVSEIQQERLFFLLMYYFKDHLPDENEISSIFQLSSIQSKSLLRNTKSRYRTKIGEYLKNTLINVLKNATQKKTDEPFEFICFSPTIIEELNTIICQKAPTLEPIQKIKGLASKYSCAIDTYIFLKEELF